MKLLQNRKAVGPIGAVFLFGVFIIMWFVFLGAWVNTVCHGMVVDNNLTGVEAFILDNMNFVIFIVLILAMMGWAYFGGGE